MAASKPNTVDLFILEQKEDLKTIFEILHSIVKEVDPGIKSMINYGLPFYKTNAGRPICYLTAHKKNSVDISFWNGVVMSKDYPLLEVRDRKLIASLNYTDPFDINIELIQELVRKIIVQQTK